MSNRPPIVISLFDYTGHMVAPWLAAGYECWLVDRQHPEAVATQGVTREGRFVRVRRDLRADWLFPEDRERIIFVSAFPPCDHLAVSGARWFAGKGLRALQDSVAMFATATEFCEWSGAPYLIENPVGTMSSYWRKPDFTFDPCDFVGYEADDNYTKKTCLWTGGGFVMPQAYRAPCATEPDDRIHKAPPGAGRKNFRSATPRGFARAVFEVNRSVSLAAAP